MTESPSLLARRPKPVTDACQCGRFGTARCLERAKPPETICNYCKLHCKGRKLGER